MAREPIFYAFLDANRTRRGAIIFSLYLAFFALVAGLLFGSVTAFYAEGRRSRSTVGTHNAEVTDDGELVRKAPGGQPFDLLMQVAALDFDPIRGVLKLNTKILREAGAGRPAVNGTLLLGSYKPVQFSSKAAAIDQDTSALMEGDPSDYPFDTYSAELPFAATVGDVLTDAATPSLVWGAVAYAQMQNFRFRFEFDKSSDASIIFLRVEVQRPPSSKVFSIFVVILMWLLTVATVTITFQVFLRDRDVAPNLLSAQASLLFAMPSVRNTQPGSPPIGTLLDTVSLFWNMTIIASCAIYTMFAYVRQGKEPVRPSPYGDGISKS
jgi:hypothetical protein